MMTGLFALSWTPVLLLTLLAIVFGQSALALSVWGLVWALVMAKGFFDTSLTVGLMSALDGVFTTLPLMLVILGGILFSSLLKVEPCRFECKTNRGRPAEQFRLCDEQFRCSSDLF